MTDAPDEIFADLSHSPIGNVLSGTLVTETPDSEIVPRVKYVRADIHTALARELAAALVREHELREAAIGVTAGLAAAISLLERGGKKAAASDKMFAQMLKDYRARLDAARTALGDRA